ncbi:RNA polymerase sigma factor [Microtetraspora sp. NBRC 13810]|uniref:RNA polymerase sigma factor n=1 Tax=Microtetraspora sp. NBRC 13810 TaxID=3030990 RepID=UPI0024A3B2CC|nr:sigma-70 family RNA polymerase sigma factor [Microtetraspora sp. NBRC 13810]GLW07923.1 RNA polymerase sigma factor [Microtetraspora sp. NBRC 13810]
MASPLYDPDPPYDPGPAPPGGSVVTEAPEHARLLRAAAVGDHTAWDGLVERFSPAMWASARAYGLSAADADDAVQGAWLRLLESLHSIRDPRGVGRWLVTTTRREALRLLRERRGEHLTGEESPPDRQQPDAAALVLDTERADLLWRAVASLSEPCRTLLSLLATAPGTGMQQIATRLGMPRGSVGPTRARCLRRLRTLVEEETLP